VRKTECRPTNRNKRPYDECSSEILALEHELCRSCRLQKAGEELADKNTSHEFEREPSTFPFTYICGTADSGLAPNRQQRLGISYG
jgi:hypothetical protein